MIRRIIKIDEEKCNGCGLCAQACHEGAIGMIDGKAKLLRDDYCDGLGDCLPVCPTGAITFEEREAAEYDEVLVKARMAEMNKGKTPPSGGCPGSNAHAIKRDAAPHSAAHDGSPVKNHSVETNAEMNEDKAPLPCGCPGSNARAIKRDAQPSNTPATTVSGQNMANRLNQYPVQDMTSQLNQWPVQIKLVPVNAPYFDGANLLISADCAAYAYNNFHNEFMKNKITLIGCPKLDQGDYSEKIKEILINNNIKSVTVVRMVVPCCGGIENAVKTALQGCGKMIPWSVVTISTDGRILEQL